MGGSPQPVLDAADMVTSSIPGDGVADVLDAIEF